MSTVSDPIDAGPTTCTECGCTSTWRAAFIPIKDGTIRRLCCPSCARRLHSKWARIMMIFTPFGLAMGLWLYGRKPYDPMVIFIMGFWLFSFSQYVLVALHEIGHAAVAWLVGAPAFAIVMGGEPWLFDRTVLGLRWRIGFRIQGGLTYHVPCEGPNARRNSILIGAAGPLTNLLIAVVALGTALALPGPWTASLGKFSAVIFGLTSALIFVRNAWPRTLKFGLGKIASDGARILALLRGEVDDVRSGRMARHWIEASFAFKDRDFGAAERATLRALELCDAPQFAAAVSVLRGASLSESDRVDEAVTLLQSLQERPIDDPGVRAGADDNLAWAYFLVDEPAVLERGLRLIESARIVVPWDDSFAITHACLLAAAAAGNGSGNGRIEQARELLDGLRAPKTHRQNRAYAALARGLIAAAACEVATARREYDVAKSRGATAAPLRVLERRLASA